MTARWVGLVWFVVAAALLVSTPARANDFEAGRRAVETGRAALDLFERGQWQAAFDAFRQADSLFHSPVFVLYMGRSKEALGQLLEARALYERVVSEPASPDDPEPWVTAREDARTALTQVTAKTPQIAIDVSGATETTQVQLDGRPLDHAAWSTPIGVDPGRHRIAVRDGDRTVEREVVVEAGSGVNRVSLTLPVPVPPQLPVSRPLEPVSRDVAPQEPRRGAGWALLGVGAAGLAVGTVTGLLAKRDADDALPSCESRVCDPAVRRKVRRGRRFGKASTASFVIGGSVSAAGVFLLIRPPMGPRETGMAVGAGGRF